MPDKKLLNKENFMNLAKSLNAYTVSLATSETTKYVREENLERNTEETLR